MISQYQSIKNKEYIICFIDVLERLSFFHRLNLAIKKSNDNLELLFITNKLSVYLIGKRQGDKIYMSKKPLGFDERAGFGGPKRTIEFLSGWLDEKGVKVLYGAVYTTMDNLCDKYKIKGIFNWNGGGISGLVSRKIAKEHKLPILFFEIGNFPGKLFVDPEGTNSDSSIAKRPHLLMNYKGSRREYSQWKGEFIRKRSNTKSISQAKKINKINGWYVVDWLGNLLGLPKSEGRGVVSKIVRYLKVKQYKKLLSDLDTKKLPCEFVYFPLQVANDTNVLLRSKYDNMEVIRKSLALAKKERIPLVIKLHPAENSPVFLNKLYEFLQTNEARKHIILSYENAVILAEKSKYNFTINSTLGLEAKIAGKNIVTLGESLYDKWTDEHIMRYIQGFLIDAAYFSDSEISSEAAAEILDRLQTGCDIKILHSPAKVK